MRHDCRGMRAKVPIAEGGLPIHVTAWGHHYGYDEDNDPIEATPDDIDPENTHHHDDDDEEESGGCSGKNRARVENCRLSRLPCRKLLEASGGPLRAQQRRPVRGDTIWAQAAWVFQDYATNYDIHLAFEHIQVPLALLAPPPSACSQTVH